MSFSLSLPDRTTEEGKQRTGKNIKRIQDQTKRFSLSMFNLWQKTFLSFSNRSVCFIDFLNSFKASSPRLSLVLNACLFNLKRKEDTLYTWHLRDSKSKKKCLVQNLKVTRESLKKWLSVFQTQVPFQFRTNNENETRWPNTQTWRYMWTDLWNEYGSWDNKREKIDLHV